MAKSKRIRKSTKRVIQSANTITEGIISTILLAGFSASRINTQGQWDPKAKAEDSDYWNPDKRGRYRPSGSRNGFYDIAACVAGLFMVIEVKFEDDELGEDQIIFKEEVQRAGGIAVEFRTFAEFQQWWQHTMLPVIDFWHSMNAKEQAEIKETHLSPFIIRARTA
jgi:hypothetical protein